MQDRMIYKNYPMLFLVCILSFSAWSQDWKDIQYQPHLIQYTTSDGLPSSEVHDIFEDDLGYLWFCTDNGLARFDGSNWLQLNKTDGLPGRTVFKLQRQVDGRVVGMTFRNGLFFLSEDKIIPYRWNQKVIDILHGDFINSYNIDQEGNLHFTKGLESLEITANGDLIHHNARANSGLDLHAKIVVDWRANQHQFYATPTAEEVDLTSDRRHIYIQKNFTFFHVRKACAHNGQAVFSIGKNIYLSDQSGIKCIPAPKDPLSFSWFDNQFVMSDLKGGLYSIDINSGKITERTGFGDYMITCIKETTDGNVWVSTLKNGVFCWKSERPQIFDLEKGQIIYDYVLGPVADGKFARTFADDILQIQEDKYAILDRRKHLAEEDRLYSYDSKTNGFIINHQTEGEIFYKSADKERVMHIGKFGLVDNMGNLIHHSFYLQPIDTLKKIYSHSAVKNILVVNPDSIFTNLSGQIYLSVPGKTEPLIKNVPNFDYNVNYLILHKDRILFSTAENGIKVWDGQVFKDLTAQLGAITKNVIAMATDADTLWTCNKKGIAKYTCDKNTNYKCIGIWEYDEVNDIQLLGNWVYFSTKKENLRFDKNATCKETQLVYFDNIATSDSLYTGKNITLAYQERNPKVCFTVIDYNHARCTEKSYRIDNGDWQAINSLQINLGPLKHGTYKMEYRLKIPYSAVSQTASSTFTILPLFYQTNWFIALAVLVALLLIWFAFALRIKRVKLKAKNEVLINELRLSSLIAQINPHFTFNILNSVQSILLKKDRFEASEVLGQFGAMLRKVLNSLNKKWITIEQENNLLLDYLNLERLRLNEQFEFKITIDPAIEQSSTYISPFIFQPFIENCIWHGIRHKSDNTGIISIETSLIDHKTIHICIEDNGVGFDASKELNKNKLGKKGSFGIKISKGRIDLICKQHQISSAFEAGNKLNARNEVSGTKVSFNLPLLTSIPNEDF